MATLKRTIHYIHVAQQRMRTALRMTSRPFAEMAGTGQTLNTNGQISSPRISHKSISSQAPILRDISPDSTGDIRTTDENTRRPGENTRGLVSGTNEDSLIGGNLRKSAWIASENVQGSFWTSLISGRTNSVGEGARNTDSSSEKTRETVSVYGESSNRSDDIHSGGRPLVVLYPWRGSTEQLREKYSNVYLQLGFEVLTLSQGMSIPVCSVPPLIRVVTRQVMQILEDQSGPFADRPVLIHCMSGGYMFTGSMLMEIEDHHRASNNTLNPTLTHALNDSTFTTTLGAALTSVDARTSTSDPSPASTTMNSQLTLDQQARNLETNDLRDRIVGMVLDCPVVTPRNARRGTELSVPNPIFRYLLKAYFSLFAPLLDPMYNQYGEAMVFLNKTPKLVLYSLSDPLCSVSQVEELVKKLEATGVRVKVRAFPGAEHVRLLGVDPLMYRQEIFQFVHELGLVKDLGEQEVG